MGLIEAVCVVHQIHSDLDGKVGRTAIDKRALPGRVGVGRLGLDGDQQADVVRHGGPDKAVYAYAGEDASWWVHQLGREIHPGCFGENLRTTGLDVTGAVIGERWVVGPEPTPLVLEVTMPRTPCSTFQRWTGEPRWGRRFTAHGAPGAYLRVLQEGTVGAGDLVRVEPGPAHGVIIGQCFAGLDDAAARRLLGVADRGELELAPALRRVCDRLLSRA